MTGCGRSKSVGKQAGSQASDRMNPSHSGCVGASIALYVIGEAGTSQDTPGEVPT